MTSDVPLDYAVFQLSPRRSRCELFVSYDGTMEKLASGFVKPYVANLKVAEEQLASAAKSIKLEAERYRDAERWFTKGTLERFVQFVSAPEVLDMVSTFDAEMSQLESARRIYSQGIEENQSTVAGGDGTVATAASDATKKELLRAIDVRLDAVKQDLTAACGRAVAAGFHPGTVRELQHFADHFGALRLSEACNKFIGLSERRSELFLTSSNPQCNSSSDNPLRCSAGSDMSIDDLSEDQVKDKPSMGSTQDKANTTTTGTSSTNESSSGTPQLTRRLSVQERISMFESKQKNSPSSVSTPSSASAAAKPELRRLSSDVNSSSDKVVLRRWSGASDMSIDVSGEKKELDTNSKTPTPSSASSNIPVFARKSKDQDSLKDDDGSTESKLPVREKFGAQLPDSGSKIPSLMSRSSENVRLKDQQSSGGRVRSRVASFGRGEDFRLENQSTIDEPQVKSWAGKTEQTASEESKLMEETVRNLVSETRLVGQSHETENEGLRSHFGAESGAAVENRQHLSRNKGGGTDSVPPQLKMRSTVVEVEKFGRKDSESFEKNQSESFSMQTEDSSSVKPKFHQGDGPVSDEANKFGGPREEGGSQLSFQEKTASSKDQELFSSVDQAQRVRQPKGNQGLNDELKNKANELEKLFAQHKLRAHGDQSNSARRTRPAERSSEQEGSSISYKPALQASPAQFKMESRPAANSNDVEELNSTPLVKTVDNQDYNVTPKHNVYSLGFQDDSRGKLYHKYMQKRDIKLREDWSSKGAEKKAKLKAMQDTLEKSRAEMMAKLSESANKRSSAYGAHNRAEKLRSFNAQSTMRREQPVDLFMSDEDEDQAEFLGRKLNETLLSDSSSRSAQSKRNLPNKNTSSATPRNSNIPIPRSAGKASNFGAGRRRLNSDNPLAQSVPNFSDLRKENTKPSSTAAGKQSRPQGRNNHARKKSISEDLPLPKEEKPRRTHTLKKTAADTMLFNDTPQSDDVDDAAFVSSKYNIEDDQYDKFSKDRVRKGNGIGQVTGLGIDGPKSSLMVGPASNRQDFHAADFEVDEMMDIAKEEENDFNGKGRLSPESDKSGNSGYEDSDAFRFSQAGFASVTGFPGSVPSIFHTMASIQDSSGESPGSWNSRLHNPFSFSNEMADIDGSESPVESAASWNLQADPEATRMRKKWGAAQKPIVGADSSHSLSRKDVTKGLKRFLKFGRKTRASESLADWISATTSEGDDDVDDGRDPAFRSSEDLRKSRMGFSHTHQSDDGFNETDILNDQAAPKSFFSLSNFRSKGSDAKPR